ncbi:MAG: DEAD/DEAH box helicase [Rhodocyclaceae bacterium]
MTFDELGLMPELLKAVADAGYTEPTPIQQQAIPPVLAGRDVMGGAQTGTGKTAGFTLPLLQRIARHANTSSSPARHPVRVLIVCPTRELAIQNHENVKMYAKYLPLRSAVVFGGMDIKPQIEELRRGVEIVVATPGRLLDHLQGRSIMLNQVEALVLDEADRMLDTGFIPDVRRILAVLPAQRQSLLFSATFSEEIKKLADTMLRDPLLIEVARRNAAAETVTHRVYPVAAALKRRLLAHLLRSRDLRQALVFVGTKFGCSRLAHYLVREGISAGAIHGDKSQQQRLEVLEAFKNGTLRVLVATDVAARGLDIEDLPNVINFDLPHVPEDYIHRIGRTGRAGKPGEAISLVCAEERGRLADIERLLRIHIEPVTVAGFEAEDAAVARGGHGERDGYASPGARSRVGARKAPPPRRVAPRPAPAGLPQPGPAADGFDWSKPYEPSPLALAQAVEMADAPSPRRGRRPVAALLGGLGKKAS